MSGQELAAATAHAVDQRIRGTVRQMHSLWVQLAEDLHRFRHAELYRDLGFDTFEAWLADPELELERRWVYQLIELYQQLVLDRNVPIADLRDLRVSKVREVLPAIRRNHVELDVALADARVLSRRDLEIRYRGLVSGGRPDVDSRIRPEREPVTFTPSNLSLLPAAFEGARDEIDDALPGRLIQPEPGEGPDVCPTCGRPRP